MKNAIVARSGRALRRSAARRHPWQPIAYAAAPPDELYTNLGGKRIYNFSAGPACMPPTVMEEVQREFINYQGSGMSFMEMSHRDPGGPVHQCLEELCGSLRQLLNVPKNYKVLLFQSGAHAQFAGVPLNLGAKKATYLVSGAWSQKSADEAANYCDVRTHDLKRVGNRYIPELKEWAPRPDDDYLYVCLNETISGLEFLDESYLDGYTGPPVIADATSTLLSRPMDVSKYGAIFASGGKNLGPAGLCVVIVREDLIKPPDARGEGQHCPSVLDWYKQSITQPIPNIYNTPPTFLCHVTRLVLKDLLAKGGVRWAERRAIERSQKIYDLIDNSHGFFENTVDAKWRSRMNVPFRIIADPGRSGASIELEYSLSSAGSVRGIEQLFGHPLFGGQRITLYNGIPDDGVEKVLDLMRDFLHEHYKPISDADALEEARDLELEKLHDMKARILSRAANRAES
jgi:phosphoserine aminotransferase